MTHAIVVEGVGKLYRRRSAQRPRTLQEAVLHGLRLLRAEESFWALQEVSFRLSPGRMAGLIGPNGAGKSTLLRLIGGVGKPDQGKITVQGRIGALLDLGAGFHPDLTGRENVFINGVISGLTRRETSRRFEAIVDFAGLEPFIDAPLRTYSTGMSMRLAFAIAVHTDPEVLLIDEVLAVGDIAFQRKCLDRITRFTAEGCAILLVTHDVSQVKGLCHEALWLRSGRVVAAGPAAQVADQYAAEMRMETNRVTPTAGPPVKTSFGTELRFNETRLGSQEMEITGVRFTGPGGTLHTGLQSGDPLRIQIDYRAPQPIRAPVFGVTITTAEGLVLWDAHSGSLETGELAGPGHVALQIERLDLAGGCYYVDVGVYREDWAYAYDYHWHVYPFTVAPSQDNKGVLCPPHCWQVSRDEKH
jgi:lipopolysaccharide transport system ATP-binding protein